VADKTALIEVIRTEREKHESQSAQRQCFNVRCSCGHIGTTVSRRGEFEEHVDEAVAEAVLAHLEASDG
jgi:hypothetical protein